jgi:hypothetical protein
MCSPFEFHDILIGSNSARTDPLVHHGRHFGRTVRAFCRVQSLIKLGLSIAVQLDLDEAEEATLPEEYVPPPLRRFY